MMIGHFIAVAFRLINFGVIIGLIAYICKKKVLPVVFRKIKERVLEMRALHHKQEALVIQHQQLLKKLADDEQNALQLKKNVDIWSRLIAQENSERAAYVQQQRVYVQKKSVLRAQESMRSKAYKQIARAAITQVQHDITQKLSNEKSAHDYFAHLINSLDNEG